MFKLNRAGSAQQRALSQWRALYLAIAVLLVSGIVAALQLPEEVYPTLDYSRVSVIALNGDLAPSLVQASITRPLEVQLSQVIGAVNMTATSGQGSSDIAVTFDPKIANINVALQRVSTAVSAIENQLPPGTSVSIQQVDPSLFPVLGYAITSQRLNQMQLRELAEWQLRPQIVGLPGVYHVAVLGGQVREYLVSADPVRMAARRITVEQLTQAISKTNTISSVGHTDTGYVRSTILAMGQAHNAQDIAAIPISNDAGTPITVGDVAEIVQAPAPPLWAATSENSNAVLFNVFAQRGASFVGVDRVVSNAMQKIRAANPAVHIERYWNQATLVSESIAGVRDAIVIGLILSALVLYFFLRNWPSTLIAAVVIPITVVITFAFLSPLHQSVNLMTMGGLAIGVGLIIDDAIVVVENTYRHLSRGEDRRSAVAAAVNEIAGPMTSSTLTTIVVFAPLALISGVAGAFFSALAITLAVALIISLALALVFTPTLAYQFLRITSQRSSRIMQAVERRYEPAVSWSLRNPVPIVAAALVLLLLSAGMVRTVGSDFMPSLDEGAFEMNYRLPPGATLSETRRVTAQIENIVGRDPAVAQEATIVGLAMTLADTPAGTNEGTLRATLKPKNQRAPIAVVMARIRARISALAPNVQVVTHQILGDMLDDLSNEAAPVEIRIFGPDQATLVALAGEVTGRIRGVRGINGLFDGAIYHNPSIVVRPDAAAGAYGFSPNAVAACESVAYDGAVVSSIIQNPLTLPVRVRFSGPFNPTLDQAEGKLCPTASGSLVPLRQLASFVSAPPQTSISELNQRQYISVTAQLAGSNGGAVANAIQQRLAGLAFPAGYSLQMAGAYQLQRRSFAQFGRAIGLAVALVFFVMLLQFRSFVQPFAILLTIPLAPFGALLALLITHQTLNISSLMGLILLIGLVVKNGILLLEYAYRAEERGEPIDRALIAAARVRLRPILMTTLTALLGMLPLAFGFGSGSELLRPLAIAVIGGLTFSTIFTLIVIPVLYRAFRSVGAHAASRIGLPERPERSHA